MKPVIGISKSLGRGFRVGIALPLIPEPKMSKREQANEKFIRDARERVERVMLKYLFSHGILTTAGTIHRLNKEALTGVSEPIESIEQNMQAIGDAVRMYNDTGSIAQPAKEKIMRNVYEIERVLSANSGSSDLLNRANSLREVRSLKHDDLSTPALSIAVLGVFVGYISSLWWVALLGIGAGTAIQIRHKKTAVAARERRFNERMAETSQLIVAGSVTLNDYIAGRV